MPKKTKRNGFEYANVVAKDDGPLPQVEKLGRDGWEIISVTQTYVPQTKHVVTTFWFKRPL